MCNFKSYSIYLGFGELFLVMGVIHNSLSSSLFEIIITIVCISTMKTLRNKTKGETHITLGFVII